MTDLNARNVGKRQRKDAQDARKYGIAARSVKYLIGLLIKMNVANRNNLRSRVSLRFRKPKYQS